MMVGAAPETMWFEDFRVGQRFASGARVITEEDVRHFGELSGDRAAVHVDSDYAREQGFSGPLVHGPFGIGLAFGLLHELGIVDRTAIAMRDVRWRFCAPIVAGDAVRLALTVTRCRRRPDRPAGLVHRHFRLLNQDDVVVQEGTSGFLVRARAAEGEDEHAVGTDFATVAWAAALRPLLEASEPFVEATRTFDGAIGLECGDECVLLRIYKGKVLDGSRSLPHGATFTLTGSELEWVELAQADRNDFIAHATRGAFGMRGDSYEYLRLTKAIVALWDAVRLLAKGSIS